MWLQLVVSCRGKKVSYEAMLEQFLLSTQAMEQAFWSQVSFSEK